MGDDDTRNMLAGQSRRLTAAMVRAAGVLALTSAGAGAVVLVGWALGLPARLGHPWLGSMKANTAVGLVLGGVALWTRRRERPASRFATISAGVISLIGVLTLAQDLLGWDLYLDQIVFDDPAGAAGAASPGRMSAFSAISMVVIGVALLVLDLETRGGHRPAQWLAGLGGALMVVPVAGHLYGVDDLQGLAGHTEIGPHTTVGLLCLYIAILLVRPARGVMARFSSDTIGGSVARRLIPATAAMVLLIGWIRLLGQRAELYGTEFGVALNAIMSVLGLTGLVWWTSGSLFRAEVHAHRAQRALAEIEADLAITLRSIGDAVIATDLAGCVVRMNPIAEQLTGWSAKEATGRGLGEVFCILGEDTREAVESPVQRVLRDGVVVGLANHTVLVSRDGTERSIADSASPIRDDDGLLRGVVLVFRDKTEEAAAEKALRHREEMFRGLLEAAPDAMVIVDARGVIKLLNAQTERLFGYSGAELVGKPVEVLIPDRFRARHPEHVRGFVGSPHTRSMGSGMDLFGRRRDGTEFPVEVALGPMSSADGMLVTAAIRDVTDRKQAEVVRAMNLELETENRRVREASRVKSEFLAHMSHELRTPLNAIIGFGEILYDGQVEPGSPQSKEFLGDILTSGRHLLQLINDVLDLSKVEAGRMEFWPETMDVRTVIGEVRGIVRTGAADKRIRVEVEVGSGLDATLDPARFKQVLYNYLSNALKFTPEGGRVVIRARPEGTDRLRLEVEDSGAGIAPADLTSLFMEFVQLDPRAARKLGGTGLGLALTKRLVEAQGGSVGVTSEVGKGSVFFAVLPRHAAARPALDDNAAPPARAAGARSVLVVEDDPRDRALLVEMLAGAGYAVETAATGKDALARASARAFDAVTLDLLLPDMSGLDVLGGIRAGGSSSQAVVVIVTVVAEARSAGGFVVHDVLGKPFEPDVLLASLKRGLGGGGRSVLVVDDDPGTVKLLAHTIERLGFEAICCTDAKTGLEAAARAHPIAVILDLLMPELDGFEFLDRLRALPDHRATPVIVWTSKDLTAQEHARLGAAAQAVVFKKGGGVLSLVAELEAFLPSRSGPRGD